MADLLSRSPPVGQPQLATEETESAESELVWSIFGDVKVPLVSELDLVKATAEDPVLCEVTKYIRLGWPKVVSNELKPFYDVRDVLSLHRKCVLHNDCVVIPVRLRETLITLAHEGHPGIVRTLQRLRETVWWPGISVFVRSKVSSCVACAVNNERNTTMSVPLSPVQWPVGPWSKVAIDIVGEFSNVPESKRFAISIIDYHSRWPEVFLCGSVTSSVVIRCLTDLFARWGIPEELVSDNGVQFVSHEFEQFLQSCDIKHVRTSLYYPQSNGLVERFNGSVKQAIRIAVAEGKPPDVAVREMLVAYRTTPQPATTVSPAQLMLGRQRRVPVNSLGTRLLLEEKRKKKTVRLAESATLIDGSGQHQRQLDVVRSKVQRHQQKMVTQFDASHRVSKRPRIQVGDWVRIRVPNRRHKTDAVFSEPHQVMEFVAPFTVRLDNHARWHMSKLKKTTAPDSDVFVSDGESEAGDEGAFGVALDLDGSVTAGAPDGGVVALPERHVAHPPSPPLPSRRSSRPRTNPAWRQKDFLYY
jgi:hypothetical protein